MDARTKKQLPSRRRLIQRVAAAVVSAAGLGGVLTARNVLAGRSAQRVRLPAAREDGGSSVEHALRARRSVRDFSTAPLEIGQVGQLLWAAQGISAATGFRTAPSAGALYPLQVYLVSGNVASLPSAIYRYRPQDHDLNEAAPGDRRAALAEAALGQRWIEQSAAVVVLTAVYQRTGSKYGERGRRYVHLEAGHAAQNICLQAVALGLATTPVGAFDDDRVKTTVGLRTTETPLYLLPVGKA